MCNRIDLFKKVRLIIDFLVFAHIETCLKMTLIKLVDIYLPALEPTLLAMFNLEDNQSLSVVFLHREERRGRTAEDLPSVLHRIPTMATAI